MVSKDVRLHEALVLVLGFGVPFLSAWPGLEGRLV